MADRSVRAGYESIAGPWAGLSGPRRSRFRPPLLPLALALLATSCALDMSVTARMGDRPPNPDPPSASSQLAPDAARDAAVPTSAGGALLAAGVTIDRFQIVLRDIRLETSRTQRGEHTPGEAVIGPGLVLVDLSGAQLDPGAMTEIVPAAHVAWKSFFEVDLDLRPVTQEEVDANPALAPLLGRTFVIQGRTASSGPFTVESSMETVLVRPATFRNGLNHNNTTINIAPNQWFVGQEGAALDPSSADPAVHAAIEANVAASIDGYMDDNRDGIPDPLG
jgi:hypothetical protein